MKPIEEEDIPNSVTHLTFGSKFNQMLKKGIIPNNVTHLTFGWDFNQPLKEGDIPNNVTHLTFALRFNQPLKKDDIPNSVTHLTFGLSFDQELDYFITNNLIELILYKNYRLSKLKLNKDILIGYYDFYEKYVIYNKYNIRIKCSEKKLFDNYISNINLNKLNGKLIMKELVEKIFHPLRLLNISNKYNIDFIDLVDIYS